MYVDCGRFAWIVCLDANIIVITINYSNFYHQNVCLKYDNMVHIPTWQQISVYVNDLVAFGGL